MSGTSNSNGNGTAWKPLATFLAGMVLAMVSFYIAEFRKTITREDAAQLIQDMRPGPPWVQDRSYVMQSLDQNRRAINECVPRNEWNQAQAQGKRKP